MLAALGIPGVVNRTKPNHFSIKLNRTSIVRLKMIEFGNRTQSNSPKNFANRTKSNVWQSNVLPIAQIEQNFRIRPTPGPEAALG